MKPRRRLMWLPLFLGLVSPYFVCVAPIAAHDMDVTSIARMFLDQIGERRYLLSVVDVQMSPMRNTAEMLPEGCSPVPEEAASTQAVPGFAFECEEKITFDDVITLPSSLAGVVVLARWSDGSEASGFFRGNGQKVPIRLADLSAGAGSISHLATTYFMLGTEHILFGVDHLLFVLGLLLLVGGLWPLVKTITAFTVAHSITLGAAVLGYVPVQSGPVEAAIALSIVLLAREIVMGFRGQEHLVHRSPWLVAFAFGLLHGLGFAGALGNIGLRASDVPPALLFFNIGVEAGQLAFVAAILVVHQATRITVRARLPKFQPALGYALGALAMLWFFERLPAVWGS
jgi:hydrogenase/urease accessory protein HupE